MAPVARSFVRDLDLRRSQGLEPEPYLIFNLSEITFSTLCRIPFSTTHKVYQKSRSLRIANGFEI